MNLGTEPFAMLQPIPCPDVQMKAKPLKKGRKLTVRNPESAYCVCEMRLTPSIRSLTPDPLVSMMVRRSGNPLGAHEWFSRSE